MGFNFKKIAAIGASILLTGMTAGLAAAAAYPAPFVQSGAANVAIVYGTGAGVSPLDVVQAGNIQTNLQSYLGSSSSGSSAPVISGSAQALDQGGPSRIWLNTSLTAAKSIFTSSDFPFLASTTFSGSTTATLTQTITLGQGTTSTSSSGNPDNSGKVIFAKMPTSTTDPRVGISMGTNATYPLYNESVTFSQPVNFTASGNQGVAINLFGNQYIVSSATTSSSLVLYGSAQTVNLNSGNSTTVTINGVTHTVVLGAVSSTQAQISVDGVSQTVNVGSTQLINGVNVGVTSAFPSSGQSVASATVLVGANVITLASGTQVTTGTSNTAVPGTMVYLTGGVNALSGLTIAVFAPQVTNSSIVKNSAFVDPVFGSFQLSNAGLNIPLEGNTSRDIITISAAGLQGMTLGWTDLMGYNGSVEFAYNSSGKTNLTYGGSSYYPIYPYEMANLSVANGMLPVFMTGTGTNGNQEGHILQLTSVYNNPSATNYATSAYTSDYVTFTDLLTGNSTTLRATSFNTSGNLQVSAPLYLDGKTYTVSWENSSWADVKYTTDSGASSAGTYILYPALSTQNHGQIELYQPLNLSLSNFDGNNNNVSNFYLPNGNGYTTISVAYNGILTGTGQNWSINSVPIYFANTTYAGSSVNVSVGKLYYEFIADGSNANRTDVYLLTPNGASSPSGVTAPLNTTAVVLLEGKDINSNYNAVVIPLIGGSNTGTSGVGVGSTYFTTSTNYSSFKYSNTNQQQFLDFWGTLVTRDSTNSGQPVATISYPLSQVYEQLYLGATSATITSGSSSGSSALQLGQVLVKDSQVSSVMNDNLIVVGGSCINSAAATLLGGAYCGSDFTTATGVGSGQFLIQSFNSTINNNGLVALLVAGYDAPDTVNAATYLTTQKPNTSMGSKYIGTTSTSAQLQVSQ